MKPQYSAISEHSSMTGTPKHIREWLQSSVVDSHASHFQSQGNVLENPILETSSLQWRIVFPSLNRQWFIWRTSQVYCRLEEGEWRIPQGDLFADTLDTFSGQFTNWGMMRNGELSGLTTQVYGLSTDENGFGYLPTPDHNEGARGPTREYDPKAYSQGGRTLTTFAKRHPDKADTPKTLFHTPTAKGNQESPSMVERGSNYFPTPHASCATGIWATPNTLDGLPPKSEEALQKEMTIARPGRSKPANLRDQVSNMGNWDGDHEKIVAKDGYSLSATWTEALMLWPLEWTSLEPLKNPVWDWTGQDWEPDIPRVALKQENRTNRLKAIGNGQCPLTMAVAFLILSNIGD